MKIKIIPESTQEKKLIENWNNNYKICLNCGNILLKSRKKCEGCGKIKFKLLKNVLKPIKVEYY